MVLREAVATVAAVLSATQIGIDKSKQNGVNYVEQLHAYYSEEEGIILNNPAGSSASTSMWYLIYPAILFTHIHPLSPEEQRFAGCFINHREMVEAFLIMKETESLIIWASILLPWSPMITGYGRNLIVQPVWDAFSDGRNDRRGKICESGFECLDYVNEFDGSAFTSCCCTCAGLLPG